MITTCKELAEILLQTPDKRVTVSIDDGTGMQCNAGVVSVKNLGIATNTVAIIPEDPVLLD